MCQGEGRIEENVMGGYSPHNQSFEAFIQERECCLCQGSGTVDAPVHENTFNHSAKYLQFKAEKTHKRKSTNHVVAEILGLTLEQLEKRLDEAA